MIQQVITCDVCGSQKRQSNHWFIACEESGDLRIGAWKSPQLLSPETKHLCGEACAHKLISHFLMKLLVGGMQRSIDKTGGGLVAETRRSEVAECAEPSSATSPELARSPGSSHFAPLNSKQLQ